MASFQDNEKRDWTIAIDALVIERIREDCDARFLLGDTEQHNTADRLRDDPALLCRVLYLLCDRQREKREISHEDFYMEVLGNGDTIEAATEALIKAIANFTPPRMRAFLLAAADKQTKIERLAIDRAMAKINDETFETRLLKALDTRLDAEIEKAMTQLESAGDSPDSSASTPPA